MNQADADTKNGKSNFTLHRDHRIHFEKHSVILPYSLLTRLENHVPNPGAISAAGARNSRSVGLALKWPRQIMGFWLRV